MRRRRAARLHVFVVATATAACDPDVVVGSDRGAAGDPPVPWSAQHETGDLSEWVDDGFGWQYATAGASLAVGGLGAHAGVAGLTSALTSTGAEEQAVVGRQARLPEGYYTAWFKLPSTLAPVGRVIFKLSAYGPYADLFDVSVTPDEAGAMRIALFDHAQYENLTDPGAAPALPYDTWFELEAYFRPSADANGRVMVWQDGALVIDTGPRVTASHDRVTFVVGSYAVAAEAEPAVTYVDDAAIRAGGAPPSP